MTVDFDYVFACVTVWTAHHREQDIIDDASSFGTENLSVIEPVRLKLLRGLTRALKNLRGDFLRVPPADPHDPDTAFARRRRDRGDSGFLIHKAESS